MKLQVTLTPEDIAIAHCAATERRASSIRLNAVELAPANLDPFLLNFRGALGELAVAKALGIDWHSPLDTFQHGYDVGIYQVRSRRDHRQPIYFKERDKHGIYILVTGDCISEPVTDGTYIVHGWITLQEVIDCNLLYGDGFLRHVDTKRLHDILTLPRLSEYAKIPLPMPEA